MLIELLLVIFLAGLVSLDKTEVGQTMLSQPLVSGPLVGLMLGDLTTGIQIGVIFQLIWFWVVPIGSALFPDTGVGGVIASALAIWVKKGKLLGDGDFGLFVLIVYVTLFSLFSGWSIIRQRKFNFRFTQKAENLSEKTGLGKIGQLVWYAILLSFLRGAVLGGLGILGFYVALLPWLKNVGLVPDTYFSLVKTAVLGFGCACAFSFFGRRANWVWIAFGGSAATLIFFIL